MDVVTGGLETDTMARETRVLVVLALGLGLTAGVGGYTFVYARARRT